MVTRRSRATTPRGLLRIIRLTANEETEGLDLSGDFTELPAEIGLLTNLRSLNLNGNRLTSLPPEIGLLTNLQELHLNGRLTSLPPEIGQLTNLQELDLENLLGSLRDLGGNQLTSLPPEIGQLLNLQNLNLNGNQLSSLPSEIGQLTNLQKLNLNQNQLTSLPAEIGQLANLKTLWLDNNQLASLPPEIGQLANLQALWLDGSQLPSLPPEIFQLTNLLELTLNGKGLRHLPPEIGQLTNLEGLYLENSQLESLPPELGLLTNLVALDLVGNPLTSLSPEIVAQGTLAILTFLRDQLGESSRQWVSKLLLVGEGGVGKTSLLRALRGEEFDTGESTTLGIEIKPVELEHPTEANVTMQLNAWDFGGQEIYHATHQFFLTGRSLYLLLWNARLGFEQGKLYYWLDIIQSKAPNSPVLIVATHTDERDAEIPMTDIRGEYPQVIGHCGISNKNGTGIDTLREQIRIAAAQLPLMGEIWPLNWLNAANSIRYLRDERHITPEYLQNLMEGHNIYGDSSAVLSQWLHDLGDIIYFKEDEELNDMVILDPQWLTKYVYRVLESEEVTEGLGIFTRDHMVEVWSDLDANLRDHFLRMMETFDLSYRTLEQREISIVVERISFEPPEGLAQTWAGIGQRVSPGKEISMTFDLNTTIPAGIPTWFIARQHRFTTHTHWRYGALLADSSDRKHMALIQVSPRDRRLQLTVRGPHPQNFFALLRDGLELTLARFPGMLDRIERSIPCPGHDGKACSFQFDYRSLERAIEHDPPVLDIQCQQAFQEVSVPGLLFGLHWSTAGEVIAKIDDLQASMGEMQEEILSELSELRALAQREFTNAFRREQEKIESHCPNVFVLIPSDSKRWQARIQGQKMDLQLYCQAPGSWHPTVDGGLYNVDQPAEWLTRTAPYLRRLVGILKFASPMIAPGLGIAAVGIEAMMKNQLDMMNQLVSKLPDFKDDPRYRLEAVEQKGYGEQARGADLRALRQLLDNKDPDHEWGGLEKILTPEGHYLWLCGSHAQAYAH